MSGTIELIAVLVSLTCIYAVLQLPVTLRLFPERTLMTQIGLSLIMGLSSQSILGFLWNHFVAEKPLIEILLFIFMWGIAIWISLKYSVKKQIRLPDEIPWENGAIAGILFIALLVRTIHPFTTTALGQSDAYMHLHFVRNILQFGNIQAPMYPPGYHWVMAGPSLIFSIDPYVMMRFGGAFFGAGLVLMTFVFVRHIANPVAGVFSALLIACFPGLGLLIKTGVGAFANQIGLLLIPSIFYLYLQQKAVGFKMSFDGIALMIATAGLMVSVPMMGLHLLLIVGLDFILTLFLEKHRSLLKALSAFMHTIPSILFTLAYLYWPDRRYRNATVGYLVAGRTGSLVPSSQEIGTTLSIQQIASPFLVMLYDYMSIKRWGFGVLWMDAVGYFCLALFIGCFFIGEKERKTGLILLGIWGFITAIQTITGALQFSAYQREGWSLLIALGCITGIVGAFCFRILSKWAFIRFGFGLAIFGIIGAGFYFFPEHPQLKSSAENEIVSIVRQAAAWRKNPDKDTPALFNPIRAHLNPKLPLTVVSRRFGGWGNFLGEILLVVAPHVKNFKTTVVGNTTLLEGFFHPKRQYLILLDANIDKDVANIGAFRFINPFQANQFIVFSNRLLRINEIIWAHLDQLKESRWTKAVLKISTKLTAVILIPKNN